MAEREQLTAEDYTHEDALARIAHLEDAIEAALDALDAGNIDEATLLLDDALGDEDTCEEEEEEEDLEDEDDED